MAEEQPNKQAKRSPAEHLKPWRFKPGQSGNPAGRKPGTFSLTTLTIKQLEDDPELAEQIVVEWIKRTIAKGGRDLEMMLNRLEGAIVQRVEGHVEADVVIDCKLR